MILLDAVVSSGEDIEVHYITKYLNIVALVSVLLQVACVVHEGILGF